MSVQIDIVRQVVEVQIVDDQVVQVAIWDGVSILNDGELVGTTRIIDFVAGTNTTVSAQKVGSKIIATINSTASSSGGTWGSITGTLSDQTDLNTALGLKAPLASPAFTGNPTAPTAALSTNTTQMATTAFVQQEIQSFGCSDLGSSM